MIDFFCVFTYAFNDHHHMVQMEDLFWSNELEQELLLFFLTKTKVMIKCGKLKWWQKDHQKINLKDFPSIFYL